MGKIEVISLYNTPPSVIRVLYVYITARRTHIYINIYYTSKLKYSAALNIPDALKSALKSALPDAQVVFLVPWVRPAGRARVCQSLGRVFSAS